MTNLTKWDNTEARDLIRKTVAAELNDLQFDMFMAVCKRTGLDPIAKQIYGLVRRSKNKAGQWVEKLSIQTSIDGFRLIAERTGKYEGQTKTEWASREADGSVVWTDYWVEDGKPLGARVGVYRAGFREPLYAFARLKSYVADGHMWQDMPEVMVAKCAEALALRKAFPQELSGLYTDDEMGQADRAPVQAQVVDKKEEPPKNERARARVSALAERAQTVSNLENDLRGSVDPGDFVIRGNTRLNGMALRQLSSEQLAWFAENAQHEGLKTAAQNYLNQVIDEQTQVGNVPNERVEYDQETGEVQG